MAAAQKVETDEAPRASFELVDLKNELVLFDSNALLDAIDTKDSPDAVVHDCVINFDEEEKKLFNQNALTGLGDRLQKADNTPRDEDMTICVVFMGDELPEGISRYLKDMVESNTLPTLEYSVIRPLYFFRADGKKSLHLYRCKSGGVVRVSNGEDSGVYLAPSVIANRKRQQRKLAAVQAEAEVRKQVEEKTAQRDAKGVNESM